MPAPAPQVKESVAILAAAPVTVAETVIARVDGISTDGSSERIDLHGFVDISTGAATTGVVLRIRRGVDTTGAQVVADQSAVGASSRWSLDIDGQDSPGDVAGQSYVLTVQQVAATGNAVVNAVELRAIIGGQ